jgi:GNAT superfamily N-acetyltransferase
MTIRWADQSEHDAILEFYHRCNYRGGIENSDKVAVALEDDLIGAVRICFENGVKVLRGMQVDVDFQRTGIGLSLLKFLDEQMDMDGCYCLPYAHLKMFYANIGFREIDPVAAPAFLAKRLSEYLKKGSHEIVIMKLNKPAHE